MVMLRPLLALVASDNKMSSLLFGEWMLIRQNWYRHCGQDLSSTVTRTPGQFSTTRRTKLLPMKPQPPVTMMFFGSNSTGPSNLRTQMQSNFKAPRYHSMHHQTA